MGFRTEWEGLSARIDGLHSATRLYFESLPHVGRDQGVSGPYLLPAIRLVFSDLRRFHESFQGVIPVRAANVLKDFLEKIGHIESPKISHGIPGVQVLMLALSVFRIEFDLLIRDVPTRAKNLIIRAFSHLQRLIVADESAQNLWKLAFEAGEPSCEKKGAVHLLMHGIWAFKASAEGERTDLILGGRFNITSEVEASAEALVLTEWKRVLSANEVKAKIEEALIQLRRYSESILAGFELADDRYIVLVSKDLLSDGLSDIHENNFTYHCINIAVSPSVPSKLASKG